MTNYCTTFIVDGKCSNCGADVESTHKYCHQCGKRLHPIETKHLQEERFERRFSIYRRWLDGLTEKEIAQEFGMSSSNVNTIVRYTVGSMPLRDIPNDIRERVELMLHRKLESGEKLRFYYDQLKVIRKL